MSRFKCYVCFLSQFSGSIAATVNNPSGGKLAFLYINFTAYLKLQKVSGYSRYTNNIL